MKISKIFIRIFALNLLVLFSFAQFGWAGNEGSNQNNEKLSYIGPAQSGGSPVGQIQHSTNYDTQFSNSASFMQSPYGAPPQSGRSYNPAMTTASDPMMASEVSPFSKYSPYMEIQGEGSNYTLGIDDVLTIIVRDQPDFSGRFVVDPDGNVQYPFVGDVKAEGKTKDQLRTEIAERLRKYVRYPEVAVMISEYRSKSVLVLGYVGNPGKYAMKGDKITVKEAVVAAGLPRVDAATSRVYVVRPSQHTADGKPQKRKVDVNKLLNKGESVQDFILQPGDTVIVNQRYFDKFVNNFSRLIGPVFQSAAVYSLGWGAPDNGFFGGND